MANNVISKNNKSNKVKPIKVEVKVTERESTKRAKALFLQVFLIKACSVSEACKAANINRTTFYSWCKKDKEFNKEVLAQRESLIDMVESRMYQKILTENPADADSQLIKFHLERKGRHRGYGEKTETNVDIRITHRYIGKPKEIKNE